MSKREQKIRSDATILSKRQRQILVVFFISFWVVGFALALWEGLGWLMLFQAIQALAFTSSIFYLLIIRLLFGADVQAAERSRMMERGAYHLVSWRLAVGTVVFIGLSFLFFWKINISIIQIIQMIFH